MSNLRDVTATATTSANAAGSRGGGGGIGIGDGSSAAGDSPDAAGVPHVSRTTDGTADGGIADRGTAITTTTAAAAAANGAPATMTNTVPRRLSAFFGFHRPRGKTLGDDPPRSRLDDGGFGGTADLVADGNACSGSSSGGAGNRLSFPRTGSDGPDLDRDRDRNRAGERDCAVDLDPIGTRRRKRSHSERWSKPMMAGLFPRSTPQVPGISEQGETGAFLASPEQDAGASGDSSTAASTPSSNRKPNVFSSLFPTSRFFNSSHSHSSTDQTGASGAENTNSRSGSAPDVSGTSSSILKVADRADAERGYNQFSPRHDPIDPTILVRSESSPRASSTFSRETPSGGSALAFPAFPQPGLDGAHARFGWPSAGLDKQLQLQLQLQTQPARASPLGAAPWPSRSQSRRPSLSLSGSATHLPLVADTDGEFMEDVQAPFSVQAPIGTRPTSSHQGQGQVQTQPAVSSAFVTTSAHAPTSIPAPTTFEQQSQGPSQAPLTPKLNPTAPSFRTIFTKKLEKVRSKDDKGDVEGAPAVAHSEHEASSTSAADHAERRGSQSASSRSLRTTLSNTESLAGGALGPVHSASASFASDCSTPTAGTGTPPPGADGSRESFMQKLSRKSSGGKFSLSWKDRTLFSSSSSTTSVTSPSKKDRERDRETSDAGDGLPLLPHGRELEGTRQDVEGGHETSPFNSTNAPVPAIANGGATTDRSSSKTGGFFRRRSRRTSASLGAGGASGRETGSGEQDGDAIGERAALMAADAA
ncbi:hypothetical protein KEM52_005427 [Ascosphaera acerosa]|nr:hypothetical protein KEM52_005427 [Ascosphaera acerosa]